MKIVFEEPIHIDPDVEELLVEYDLEKKEWGLEIKGVEYKIVRNTSLEEGLLQ